MFTYVPWFAACWIAWYTSMSSDVKPLNLQTHKPHIVNQCKFQLTAAHKNTSNLPATKIHCFLSTTRFSFFTLTVQDQKRKKRTYYIEKSIQLTWQPLLYLALCRQLCPLESTIVTFAAYTTKICQKLETTITESQEGLNPKSFVGFKPKFFWCAAD